MRVRTHSKRLTSACIRCATHTPSNQVQFVIIPSVPPPYDCSKHKNTKTLNGMTATAITTTPRSVCD